MMTSTGGNFRTACWSVEMPLHAVINGRYFLVELDTNLTCIFIFITCNALAKCINRVLLGLLANIFLTVNSAI